MLTNTFGVHEGVGMIKARVWVDEMDKFTSVKQKATWTQEVASWIKQLVLNVGREQWVFIKHQIEQKLLLPQFSLRNYCTQERMGLQDNAKITPSLRGAQKVHEAQKVCGSLCKGICLPLRWICQHQKSTHSSDGKSYNQEHEKYTPVPSYGQIVTLKL